MHVLVLGSGGREHALCWKLKSSPIVEDLYCLPGNPGMTRDEVIVINENYSKETLMTHIREKNIKLVVVGQEKYLEDGVADFLEENDIWVVGPSQKASMLETSKEFSKNFMQEFGIPTAQFKSYDNSKSALDDLANWDFEKGVVIKADELAAGKGVVVTHDLAEAKEVISNFMDNPNYGVRTKKIVIEEKLLGKEVSVFILSDGTNFLKLGMACDHKRLLDGDKGPNTGGMGCYTPREWPEEKDQDFIYDVIAKRTLEGMQKRGTPYKGILYMGLMITEDGPKVIEYNVRFGDPEAQTLMPLIDEDIMPHFLDSAKGELKGETLSLKKQTCVHVTMASQGYPSLDGKPMLLDQKIDISYSLDENCFIFYAGVKDKNNKLHNNGGRVLGVSALGDSISMARDLAYSNLKKISFNGAIWRSDIGK